MFGIRFIKVLPTTYLLHYQNGAVKRAGAGLSFFYYSPTSSLVTLPLSTIDLPFVFTEVTLDYQTITVQGQVSYRVTEPQRLAGLLDFSIHPNGGYRSDDPTKLGERLIHTTQSIARAAIQRLDLRNVLLQIERLVAEVLAGLKQAEMLQVHGLEVTSLSILSIKPTPEMSKALEAEAREGLQRQSDEAIYARRNAAVEQERKIKESELNTQIAITEKQRQIREAQMQTEIAVETQRASLIDQKVANDRKEADSRSYSLQAVVGPLKGVDWRTLMAMGNGMEAKQIIAMAFQEMAGSAGKIGELNISPDLLRSLIESE